MALTDTELKLCRRFFELDLSSEELEQFEFNIDKDPVFKMEVQRYGNVRKAIVNSISKNIVEPEQPQLSKSIPVRKHRIAIAIMGLVIIVAAFITYQVLNNNSQRRILIAECETYVHAISGDTYRTAKAIEPQSNKVATGTAMMEIESLYEAGKFSAIEKRMEALLNSAVSIETKETCEWWLVCVYLKTGNTVSLRNRLASISNENQYNSRRKAQQYLKKIN